MLQLVHKPTWRRDTLISVGIFALIYAINTLVQSWYETPTLVPMLFVLGVFVTSMQTQGYLYGILSSLLSVLAVNFAFTLPYYAFNLITPEYIAAALIMLIVSIATCTLTNKVKQQEKLKAEGEMERMRANLLRAVSHDLRTPLTSIYGSCSIIRENYNHLSREQQLTLLQDVEEDADWLIRMVENLLSITKIGASQVRLIKTPVVLEELIDSVLLKFSKRNPNQTVLVDIPDTFLMIPMDAMLIEQVLYNLLENAVHHAQGMTELHLQVYCRNHQAIFEVRDNGSGIPDAILKDIFSGKAVTGNDSDSNRNMGIGLSVCSAIIRAHDGKIEAANAPDGGAILRFTLDMEEDHEQQSIQDPAGRGR